MNPSKSNKKFYLKFWEKVEEKISYKIMFVFLFGLLCACYGMVYSFIFSYSLTFNRKLIVAGIGFSAGILLSPIQYKIFKKRYHSYLNFHKNKDTDKFIEKMRK